MSDYIYCGVWRRFGAYIIDLLTLLFTTFCISFILYFFLKIPYLNKSFYDWFSIEENFIIFIIINMIFFTAQIILYWVLFESSKLQATPGKYLLNMKIINKNETKISFLKSFFRLLVNILIIIFGFGIVEIINIFCIVFTKQKTSIPDMICGTRVVRR
ncbi:MULTISPECIES: RDD family protein [unclassified Rickettsia]|uniref:RDD family protein n=1 Tax=unclassified Rickettsia TaxID=114295 RepID=UPI0031330674